jgi:DNA polymerase-3 subunit delta'
LLISGQVGIGKRHLAELLARALLCRAPDARGMACGRCADCVLVAAQSHPDLQRVGPDPESKSGDIPVSAIRSLVERGALTPSRADWKVTLIDPADHLNTAAANALLKTLEEPPGAAVLVLVAESPARLPATIRSRCQQIRIASPSHADALAWLVERVPAQSAALRLAVAHGAPLAALMGTDEAALGRRDACLADVLGVVRGERDPLVAASAWHQMGPSPVLDWWSSWLVDLVRLSVSPRPPRLENPDQHAALSGVARSVDASAVHRLLQRLLRARGLIETSVNAQLLLESLAIEWHRIGLGHAHGRSRP